VTFSRVLATLLAAAVASSCCPPGFGGAPANRGGGARDDGGGDGLRLVVLVIVDQWPSWGFDARRDLYEHGLGRLLREGQTLTRVEYPYSGTFTAAGHATMATGAPPSVHGMIANGWWRREYTEERQAEYDDSTKILSLPGRDAAVAAELPGASGKNLRVDGLAEALRDGRGGRARSVVIGGKTRAACLAGGRRPDVALWYEPKLKGFTSSAAYGDTLPSWALALDREHPIAALLDDVWDTADKGALAARTGIPDDAPGEGAEYELGITFPHRIAAATDPAKALRATPLLDGVQIEAAIAAIAGERLGADADTDLLVVSLSSHDYAGHNWGQESWEIIEHERVIDRELGRLLDALDGAVGHERYAVLVTSDHGATPLIERGRFPGARRIPPTELHDVAEAAVAKELGPGDWIDAVSSGMVYLSLAAGVRAPADRERAIARVATDLAAVPQVARVIRLDTLPADCAGLDELAARACRSRVAGESGELLVVPARGSIITLYETGTSHDSPSDENRYVPLIVRVPGNPPLGDSRTMLSLAPTIAALLGVSPPPAATAPTFFRDPPIIVP
jgi:hypothetical protein